MLSADARPAVVVGSLLALEVLQLLHPLHAVEVGGVEPDDHQLQAVLAAILEGRARDAGDEAGELARAHEGEGQ